MEPSLTTRIAPQTLFELALPLTSHRTLEPLLETTLTAFVTKLGALGGAVFELEHSAPEGPRVTTRARRQGHAHASDLARAEAHLASSGPLPAEFPGEEGQLWLVELPGFGALCLILGARPLSTNISHDLTLLLSAFGRAAQAARRVEEEAQLEETRLMAEMLAARTRELAARTRELDIALQKTRDVSRLKEELLASLSHELRTPLNAVLGLAEALQEEIYGPLSSAQLDSIKVIEQSGRKLLALLTDMMDFVRIGSGQMDTLFAAFDLTETAQIAARRARKAIQEKGLRVVIESDGADLEVLGDAAKTQRIVGELLSNAIKFSEEGGRVTLSTRGDDERASIMIADEGCGIAKDKLNRLFEPFVQVEGGLKRRHGGTGLGLALSSRLARLVGAELQVESVQGEGSCFTLTLRRQGPQKLEIFSDLNCPDSYILHTWVAQTKLAHLVAWRGVEHMPELTREQALSETEQRRLDEELSALAPRSEGLAITRPVRRSNTHAALCVLKHIETHDPGRSTEARSALFEAIWVKGEDISELSKVVSVLSEFELSGFTISEVERRAIAEDTAAWREDPEPVIPTVISPAHGRRHRGLGHRALLHQFMDEELGFLSRQSSELKST